MRLNKYLLLLAAVPALVAATAGSYMVRWLSVLFLGVLLALFLFGVELQVARPEFKRAKKVERKTDIERTVALIEKAKSGKVARTLIEEKIIEIYATLSEDYNQTYLNLNSDSNEALRILRSEGDFLDNLEKALAIVEADLNEGRRGKPEG
ncbi:hypothetical protein E3E26_02785 [Thermococcus sp. LS1]|uniref:hypothetical protein n=1 Tax=Thermococcus sp. LS1 TaxID=1638259 RepID=UPI00143A26A5|nr:hypothetical protein [Thermococcus sp. LS1]NJD98724.1 hypothetical protein [Thermococcus sp. LS1]